MANFQKNVIPAPNKNISKVEGDAFLVASTNNYPDFKDTKELFKDTLEKALKEAPDDKAKIEIYQDAVRGFLMQLGQKEPEDLQFEAKVEDLLNTLDSFERSCQSKATFYKYQMPVLCTMGGLTILAWVLYFIKLVI